MQNSIENSNHPHSSFWWKRGLALILILEFSVLIWVTTGSYYRKLKPPIPEQVIDNSGAVVFTGTDIENGQQVFLKRALMNNGSVWGHGAYLGPDFSAQYLHNLVLEVRNYIAVQKYNTVFAELAPEQKESLVSLSHDFLANNRYNEGNQNLLFTDPEAKSFKDQISYWNDYFQKSPSNRGLPSTLIVDQEELRQLTAFFSWAAWVTTANVPGRNYSYTNNFPYEPLIGNGPSSAAILLSCLN
jgi:nitric oxide reductase subunit B